MSYVYMGLAEKLMDKILQKEFTLSSPTENGFLLMPFYLGEKCTLRSLFNFFVFNLFLPQRTQKNYTKISKLLMNTFLNLGLLFL